MPPSLPRGPDEGSGVVPRAGMKIVTWKVHNIIRLLTTVVLVIASFTHTLIAHHMSSEIDYVIDHAFGVRYDEPNLRKSRKKVILTVLFGTHSWKW